MYSWSKYPFVRMLLPFAFGIWCCVCIPVIQISSLVLIISGFLLLGLAILCSVFVKTIRFSWLFGMVMVCYLFLAGYALTKGRQAEAKKDYYRCYEADAQYYVARVYDCPTERERNFRTVLELEYQFGDSLPSRPVSGKVMAYFPKSDAVFTLRYGDLIAIPAPIREVTPPMNPGEFDYRAYLHRKGITGQVYLKEGEWMDLQTNNANPLYSFSYRFRDILLASLHHSGLNDDEFGVASAILLGYDDNLADDVRKNYVAAGSMHILCVSGMHVGIIYLLASFLLGFLNRKQWQKTLKQALLLVLVWLYALVAGLSPSILRASLMITFVIIGEMIRRKGFIINSIAASAFFLLCVNPYNLFEIGFQLSYAAVIGIVVLQRPIYNLLYIKNKILDRAWEITTVALAAQVATIPFTLFYFNQFSTYFWLANLFMTPISFVVVVSGMVLLLVSWIPYLNVLVGYLVWGAVFVMNWIVARIESLPGSILKGLHITGFEFGMLLLAFLLLLLMVTLRKKQLVIPLLSVVLLVMVSVTMRLYQSETQKGMTVFSLRNHTAVDFVRGGEHLLMADSALMDDASIVEYSLAGSWTMRNLTHSPEVIGLDEDYDGTFLRKRSNLVSFDGKLMALWNDDCAVSDSLPYRLPVDYLLVAKNSTKEGKRIDLQLVTNGYQVDTILIDGSVPGYLAERWIQQAEAMGIPYYNIREGALDVEFCFSK